MITLRRQPGQKYLELGGGDSPKLTPRCMGGEDICVDIRSCFNAQGQQTVDFTCNFDEPLPIGDEDFDGVFSHFALEHVSYRNIPAFLKEVLRVLKPKGKATFCVPNTRAQIDWILSHQEGWDNHNLFDAASELLFGTQDYSDNTHKAFFSVEIAYELFKTAGFENVNVRPYGARDTDLVIEAMKPGYPKTNGWHTNVLGSHVEPRSKEEANAVDQTKTAVKLPETTVSPTWIPENAPTVLAETPVREIAVHVGDKSYTTEELFDKHYFHGGKKVGGYKLEGYRDFPVHEVTFQHIMSRKPESVLEIGCARGYILKRIQDTGARACGLEVSHHCWLTRACDGILEWDICKTPWPWKDDEFDMVLSVAVLEHIPEQHLPNVLKEISRVGRGRGLHGIDFGEKDDGFDKTHCTLRSKQWWTEKFAAYGHVNGRYREPEIVNKEELEQGEFPKHVLEGDGKVKINVGSFTSMFHNGWINIDVHNLEGYAQANHYRYVKQDVRNGLPFKTGEVDLIYSSHFLEHLNYKEGLAFLRDCRRVIKPDGAMRFMVPDANLLMARYLCNGMGNWSAPQDARGFDDLNEVNDGCETAPTGMTKLWALLMEGHQSLYDQWTLGDMLVKAGFGFRHCVFRQGHPQIIRETIDSFPCLSLFMEAIPAVA